MDRIDRLRIFTRVVECQSFTRAADTLAVPRSTVSMAIKELEEIVGTRLLNRTTRSVSPSNDGTAFYERAIQLMSDVEEVEGLFRTSSARLSGKLKINVPGRIGRLIIAPALPDFFAKYPGIALEIGITDRAVDLQHEGVDCVIRVGALADSNLIARRIGDIDIINCASKAYLKAHGTPRRAADLKRHRAVIYASPSSSKPEPWEYVGKSGPQTVAIPQAVAVDNAEMMIACCLAGLGLIQIPAYDVRPHIAKGELVEVLPRHRAAPLPVHILYPHRRHLSGRLQAFIDWASALLRSRIAQ
ncbi:MAG: LysR family transcriptional regulator [Hyphomicrobiaceae bacterium]